MSIGIDELFEMISWNSDEETQRRGIELAKDITCLSVFLMPHGGKYSKDIWENCAKIICSYPDEILIYYLTELLEWIEDINWPGAEIVFERLCGFSNTEWLTREISDSVKIALVQKRNIWLNNILALYSENKKLENRLPEDIFRMLLAFNLN